ncbi:VWA domain-containing protein [Epilithonimonas zeae]|uniref:VWA domain-containing protein n=1 Tax=Epilithonimonas zeae TaxID=1416779 RepID=UPI0020108DF5|nr:VWA domain-containing protein [Epilithonimonas zeae]UQB69766.1 VWA domain-containing protein [Epilithonimonas zeae]
MENQDIDKMFSDAGKSAEENPTFPSFEKVWEKVEEKLDKKEQKKGIIPIWLPYGIAAGLALTFGVLYFMNDDKAKIELQIASNDYGKPINPNLIETPKKVEEINKTFKENLAKSPIKPAEVQDIIAYHEAQPKNNDAILFERKPEYVTDENNINRVEVENISVPPPIPKLLETTSGLVKNEVYEPTYSPPPAPPSNHKSASETKVSAMYATEIAEKNSITGIKDGFPLGRSSLLEGKALGLKVNKSNSATTLIRGLSSYDKSKEPLYIVDGKEESSKILTVLNPNSIESMQILKKEAATSLYGSKALNGVVIIKTKNLSRKEKRALKKQLKTESKEALQKQVEESEKDLPDAGKLTAGEVNDFSKWNYWQDIAVPILDQYKNTWKFFPDKRVSVQLTNLDNNPVIGKKLKLINDKKEIVWESITDNRGNAELWISSILNQNQNYSQYSIVDEDGNLLVNNAKEFRDGQNLIKINESCTRRRALDLVFVVDATGSMGDEINYLKSELLDVLKKVESNLTQTNVRYGSVFYRDNGDEYVTRKFDFSNNSENLINFIKKQDAKGGGDTPEAVVEALDSSIDELAWSNENSTKIMFLLLDAPPHLSEENIERLHQKIKLASKKGIIIIPIAASDTDKQTEYLMRTFALLTNGTYTFLTNDSGIGNNHIKPTASEYEVEKLNDLLLRLILQRSTVPDCKDGVTKEYINKKLEVESLDKKDFATKIYPNPTKGSFKIDTKRDVEEFVLYDYTGKILIKKNNLVKGLHHFDISNYPQSVYLVKLKYGTDSETFKLIKN